MENKTLQKVGYVLFILIGVYLIITELILASLVIMGVDIGLFYQKSLIGFLTDWSVISKFIFMLCLYVHLAVKWWFTVWKK